MKGIILSWNNGKGYRLYLLPSELKQPATLKKQGRSMVYLLDEDLNIKEEKGKKLIAIVTMADAKVYGYQD